MPRHRGQDDRRAKEPRVDRRIRVPEVLVIDADGTKLGTLPTHQALRRAQDQGLNLVEVAPNSRPPVCRILDYGKYKYDLKQKAKQKKKNQVTVEIKEVKFRPKVEKHDFDHKIRRAEKFLGDGDKVKCTIMFRGRELAHPEMGELVLRRVLELFGDKVIIEQQPKLEGRNMTMQIAGKPGAWKKQEKPAQAKHRHEEEDVDHEDEDDSAEAEAEAEVSAAGEVSASP